MRHNSKQRAILSENSPFSPLLTYIFDCDNLGKNEIGGGTNVQKTMEQKRITKTKS